MAKWLWTLLLIVAVIVLVISAGILHFAVTVHIPISLHPPAPGVHFAYALGKQSLTRDAEDVKKQVRMILTNEQIDAAVWRTKKGYGGSGYGWVIDIDVSPIESEAEMHGAKDRLSKALSRQFPQSKCISYSAIYVHRGPMAVMFVTYGALIFFAVICLLAIASIYLLLKRR